MKTHRKIPPHATIGFRTAVIAISLLSAACSQSPSPDPEPRAKTEPKSAAPLRLLVVDDAPLAAAIQRAWQARADTEIDVQEVSAADLLAPDKTRLSADAVIFPEAWLGAMAERDWLEPMADDVLNGAPFNRRDIFELVRNRVCAWGESTIAVPLGSPTLLVAYRRDLFEQRGVQPPQSWPDLQRIAKQLAAEQPGDDGVQPADKAGAKVRTNAGWSAIVEPLGPGWAGQMLLARAASYARHRNFYSTWFNLETMEPLIAGPAFVRALQELKDTAPLGPPDAASLSPAEAWQRLSDGRCALAITWPHRSSDARAENQSFPLGFVELPGSSEVYNFQEQTWQRREGDRAIRVTLLGTSGRIAAVSKASRQKAAAMNMLLRLTDPQWNGEISPYSPATAPFRDRQAEQAAAWLGTQSTTENAERYFTAVRSAHTQSLSVFSPRLPGRERYLAALDKAVHAALTGEKTPQATLEQAANQWRLITNEIGIDTQRDANWRSWNVAQ